MLLPNNEFFRNYSKSHNTQFLIWHFEEYSPFLTLKYVILANGLLPSHGNQCNNKGIIMEHMHS